MVSTYKLMSQILIDSNKELSNEDLAVKYQEDFNPTILAEIFCRNFKLLCGLAFKPQYKQFIDKDSIASYVVESIDKALKTYKVDSGYKFMTYLGRIIVLQLQWELNRKNHKGRSEQVYSLDMLLENTDNNEFEVNFIDYKDKDLDMCELLMVIDMSELKEKEKQICRIIIRNPRITEQEIGNMLDMPRITVHAIKDRLKMKLSTLLTI